MAVTRANIYRAIVPELLVINCAPLYEGNEAVCGIYIGAKTGGKRDGDGLNGTGISRPRTSEPISVYISRDGGVSYDLLHVLTTHVVTGRMNATDRQNGTVTGDFSGLLFDTRSGYELAHTMNNLGEAVISWDTGFTPTSCTDARLYDGANRCLIGDEVVAYKTVSAVSTRATSGPGTTDLTSTSNTYFHSGFLRGLRGTEGHIQGASDNTRYWDLVVNIDPEALVFVPLPLSDVGRTLLFKAATPGLDLSDAIAYELEVTGRTLKPFGVMQAWGVRDASNNLTISWYRRTRTPVRLMGAKGRPYGEDANTWKVEILSGAAPYTVLRTIDATTESCTYTAAQHSTDGLTAGGAVNIKIYQWSEAVGWGLTNQMQIPANTGGTSTPTPNYKIPATLTD